MCISAYVMSTTRSFGTQLRAVTAKLDGDVQSIYDEMGISFRPRFYPVVQRLRSNGPTRVNDLAKETGASQPATTQTIAEMAKLGLVAASTGSDGRERLISLTPMGERTVEELRPVWLAIEGAAKELNAELPMPLGKLLACALQALDRDSFKDRIRRKTENG